jgi:hypothetical protein
MPLHSDDRDGLVGADAADDRASSEVLKPSQTTVVLPPCQS